MIGDVTLSGPAMQHMTKADLRRLRRKGVMSARQQRRRLRGYRRVGRAVAAYLQP